MKTSQTEHLALLQSVLAIIMISVFASSLASSSPSQVSSCIDGSWTPTSTAAAPIARTNHAAVWTGSEMIVWGGAANGGVKLDTGGRYNPGTDSWTPTSTATAPIARTKHTAVWTGCEMIVWGGESNTFTDTGGRYNPGMDSWTATSTTNAPSPRDGHTAIWTGSEMIIWGGSYFDGGSTYTYFNNGGRYNPCTNSWRPISTINAPTGRAFHTAVWTGTEMIVWGGFDGTHVLSTGWRYNPVTDSWAAITVTNAPTGRRDHTAVWTGSEMIVWGGNYLNTGGKYNPSTNSWTATTTVSAPGGRTFHTAVWTGGRMIIWGGNNSSVALNTGGTYNPGTDSWTATSTTNVPALQNHTAVLTDTQMVVWGGRDVNFNPANVGGSYCAISLISPTPSPTPGGCACGAPPTPTPTPEPTPTSNLCVMVTATAGTLGPTGYVSVKDAFDAINAGTHQGAISISVTCDILQGASAVLNASGIGAAFYTLVEMTPSGARTITASLAAPLIDLNGADNVAIDGLNIGGNSLTLCNANTGAVPGTSTIRFINGATGNTVRNCSVMGASTGALNVDTGTILFGTSVVAGGNSHNKIFGNDIGPCGNLPTKGVMGLGSVAPNDNTLNVIDNNNIFDFFNPTISVSGISVQVNNSLWLIDSNRFYQTAPRVFTVDGVRYAGITVNVGDTTNGPGGSFTIIGNTVGFGASDGSGTTTISGSGNEFRGIIASGTDVNVPTSIQNNTISGIDQNTSRDVTTFGMEGFVGITLGVAPGDIGLFHVGDEIGNRIGSLDGSSTIVLTARSTTSGPSADGGIFAILQTDAVISNNEIGSIIIKSGGTGTTTGFFGIFILTFENSYTLNNNSIGGPGANSIVDTIVGDYPVFGVYHVGGALSATGNKIRNITGNGRQMRGFLLLTGFVGSDQTLVSTVSQNSIHSLTNTVGASADSSYNLVGMVCNLSQAANVVERNFIHSNSISTTSGSVRDEGIDIGSGTASVKNNVVRMGIDSAGNSITTPHLIIGIRDGINAPPGTRSYSYNSVYIGGSGVTAGNGASNTFAFSCDAFGSSNSRDLKNNIFWNARSNAIAGGPAHFAIALPGTVVNPPGITSDFNDLFASGTDGAVGAYNATIRPNLAAWQAATALDTSSLSVDPLLVNPTGAEATLDLHLTAGSPVLGHATPITDVTNDFDNDPRDPCPDIGADEIVGGACSTPVPMITIAGHVSYCPNPASGPVPGVSVNITGDVVISGVSDPTGNYTISVPAGGSYVATPTKPPLAPASAGITTTDVLAIQRHYVQVTTLTGCKLIAADVNEDSIVSTIDVIAIQRFFTGRTFGTANTGQYRFMPLSRTYNAVVTDQNAQDYSTIVLGDVAGGYVHRPMNSVFNAPGSNR